MLNERRMPGGGAPNPQLARLSSFTEVSTWIILRDNKLKFLVTTKKYKLIAQTGGLGSGRCLQNIQLMLGRGMVREPGGVIFLSSGPDCRRCGLFIAACTQLARQGPGCGCCQRWGALQMLSGNLRWTILQRFASSQNLHIYNNFSCQG